MEFTKIKLKLILVLWPVLLILNSCGQTTSLTTDKIIPTKLPANCWLLQPVTYKFRQSAKLEYRNSEKFFEGFLKLDLQHNLAHLVIFTDLGVTLLNLEIKPHSFNFADRAAHNQREQHFAAAVADSVQKIFFSLENHNNPNTQLQINFRKISDADELVSIKTKQSDPDWIVTYNNYQTYPCGRIPQRIFLQNHRPEFKLTLWLHKVESNASDAP